VNGVRMIHREVAIVTSRHAKTEGLHVLL
jgi:hypothetical protein